MLLNPAPLAATVAELQDDALDLHLYIDQLCDRIDANDGDVQAFLPEPERRARLHREASALLAQYPRKRPDLFGVLVGVKDVFHVDGFVTRAGAEAPPDQFAGTEAAVVKQLRTAGALIAGKTVTTEFAYFEPGPTRNPWNLAHTPGGSSSGSAAAVAAGMCPLALGTQTIGSVIRPAAFCGVVGFKPSAGRIPTEGLVYFSRTMDQVGFFTQDVAGMQRAAAALCRDWGEVELTDDAIPILGIPDGPYLRQASPEARAVFARQVDLLRELGYTVWNVPTLLDIEELNQIHRRLVFAEFAREHKAMYAKFKRLYRPRTAEIIEIGKKVSDGELDELRAGWFEVRDALEKQMEQAGIDFWVCPAAIGPAPEGIASTGDPNMSLPWTYAGLPAVTIPVGRAANGLPLGLQLIGQTDEDEVLLACAGLMGDELQQ
ncbi:MAG: amidase [Anaerolineales bacterium]|nr:amidase [Anaerolineales bacterium]